MAQVHSGVVNKLYKSVIDDVISRTRDIFLDEGIDEQVLVELRSLWEQKLAQTKAVLDEPLEHDSKPDVKSTKAAKAAEAKAAAAAAAAAAASSASAASGFEVRAEQPASQQPSSIQLIPVQINIPMSTGSPQNSVKTITIQVPSTSLQTGASQLQTILSSPAATAAMALPIETATDVLQKLINQALLRSVDNVSQLDGASFIPTRRRHRKKKKKISVVFQFDGAQMDSSDDDEDDEMQDDEEDEDEDDDEDDKEKDKQKGDKDLRSDEDEDVHEEEEEPLNSEDDLTDEDPATIFDTENVVVCQYDKISHARNRWRFNFKDGIMNLVGRDYVFQRAVGDAEW
ncbi:unnamed protein product [Notodromas monacha]|uniref:Transcription initiation factor IIA subunit 1 n=1 Tax=Notodromas monacha TaxID=399045 RepID=A0A7R9GA65_9CRUS|nr:unnamed protein product [Notodromas monacha]CAG0915010.1 unnamed protein product [Notodromas monacha]